MSYGSVDGEHTNRTHRRGHRSDRELRRRPGLLASPSATAGARLLAIVPTVSVVPVWPLITRVITGLITRLTSVVTRLGSCHAGGRQLGARHRDNHGSDGIHRGFGPRGAVAQHAGDRQTGTGYESPDLLYRRRRPSHGTHRSRERPLGQDRRRLHPRRRREHRNAATGPRQLRSVRVTRPATPVRVRTSPDRATAASEANALACPALGGRTGFDSRAEVESRTLLDASSRSSTDRASDYGSEGWGFESLRLRTRSKAHSGQGWAFDFGRGSHDGSHPGQDPNRARLIDVAAARLSPCSSRAYAARGRNFRSRQSAGRSCHGKDAIDLRERDRSVLFGGRGGFVMPGQAISRRCRAQFRATAVSSAE
jgi:hypothetical protein